MNKQFKGYAIILLLIVLINFGFGQELTGNILLGQSMTIESEYLDEAREVFIHVPDVYMNSDNRYPVMYVLDGENHFFMSSALSSFFTDLQQIPNLIIVAIPNVNRNRDFTPLKDERTPNAGGAEDFINFMKEELIPIINNNYRTQGYDILFGHSLTGMFSIYTLFNHTDMFDAYLAASPFVMYSDNYVVNQAEKMISEVRFSDKTVFMSIGDEPNYFDSLDKLTNLFGNDTTGLTWTYNKYEKDNHDTIPIATIMDGLKFIFNDWPLNQEVAMGGLDAIKNLLKTREQKYGIKTELNEIVINTIGYQLLQANEIDKAIEVFKYNVELFPNSSNVYDSLGDAYDAKGATKKALKNYRKAVGVGTIENSPNLPIYKSNVKRLENLK